MRQTHLKKAAMCSVATLATVIGPAHAALLTHNIITDIETGMNAECGVGESIQLSGSIHHIVSFTVNDNRLNGFIHFQPILSGVGLDTGTIYHVTEVQHQTFNLSLQNGQASFTVVHPFRVIGQGPGNNFLTFAHTTLKFNADGTVTVSNIDFTGECR
jgi:hypothetical protein